ncbi:class I SAM-dependent methyltransferase [Alphaproteobacteria bacterium]|nr:class I SAM-dependent methyltransferase [Alphaproteobacteria bacterium]
MKSYLDVVYDPKKRSQNNYPKLLCEYISSVLLESNKGNFIEFGCGTCEHLKIFKNIGYSISGVDLDSNIKKYSDEIKIFHCDVQTEKLDIRDNSYDVVFSKSFIEHLSEPDKYLKEAYRILKPGGKILTMVPDWESNVKIYFDDHTHKTPFTIFSLSYAYEIHGFKNIKCSLFRQLPLVWKFPLLNYFCNIIAFFTPHRSKNTFLRWSKELMIVGIGEK